VLERKLEMQQNRLTAGLSLYTCRVAHSTSPDPLARGRGLTCGTRWAETEIFNNESYFHT